MGEKGNDAAGVARGRLAGMVRDPWAWVSAAGVALALAGLGLSAWAVALAGSLP